MVSPEAIAAALARIHPRHAQVLISQVIEGRSRTGAAALYGLPPEGWDRLLARAGGELAAALEVPLGGDEAQLARALAHGTGPLADLLAGLVAQAPAIRGLLEQAEQTTLRSPANRREQWLRRAAIVAILGLTAYYWWRDGTPPLPGSTPTSRVRNTP